MWTLQDAQKSSFGDISIVFNYPQEGDVSCRIKNSSGNILGTFLTPYKKREDKMRLPVNIKLYQIETGSGSFHLDVTQEIRGRIKANHVSNIDILDLHDEKCLSLCQTGGWGIQFEATLYQGMSPFVANSLIVLIAHAMWPPKPQSSGGGGG